MNRAGLLVAAGGAVVIGLAPVVPLLVTHDRAAFAVPEVHFYAVSATALVCAGLAALLGVLGVRRRDRRTAGIGAGFTVIAALLAVHGLTTPGFLIDSDYTAAVGVSGALAVPLGGGVILASLLSRPRQLGYVRDLVLLQIGVVAVMVAFGALALLAPDTIPSVPVALRPLVWWIVAGNALIYGILSLRALRTFQLTRRLGDLAVAAGLVWLAIAVATYLLSPVWSVGFWGGHVLELGAFLVVTAALASDLIRATPSRALHSEIDVRDVVTEQEALLGAWVGRLLARLAAKDTSTREHTRRVAQLAVEVGQELDLRGARLRGLAVAALLHDVGKLQVPDAILCKAGPLTPAEFAMIKRHPGDGEALLAHIGGFAEELALVRGHHERLDGSGYPDGLRGGELSLEVRILAVCDVYDALTSERVYRRAYSQAQAIAILDRGRGSVFDSDVLDALSRVVDVAPVLPLQRAA
ncbi:MAG: HD-GYP domain-containing protein [Actinomycetota bacterium]|nr:HD-GYP domain-containing protein [Actinomycetota bacterium]